jgi:hypothetical protein
LELAAAQCRSFGPEEVLRRLRLGEHLVGDATRTSRHRTLEDLLDWSYRLLSPLEQRVFARLALFSAPVTLRVAGPVVAAGGSNDDATQAVAFLVDHSLVQRDGTRFRLLETTRRYALERLEASGELPRTVSIYVATMDERVREIHKGLRGPDEAAWVDVLDVEWPDVRRAVRFILDRGDAEMAASVLSHLAFEAFYRRPEAFEWIDEAVARFRSEPSNHRHELLAAAVLGAMVQLDLDAAQTLTKEALAAESDPKASIDALPAAAAAGMYFFCGDFTRATATCESAIALLGAAGVGAWGKAQLAASEALALVMMADPGASRAVEVAARAAEVTRNPTVVAYAAGVRALHLAPTNPDLALALLEQSRDQAMTVRNQYVVGLHGTALANAYVAAGQTAEGLAVLLDDSDYGYRIGYVVHAWTLLWSTIDLLFQLGRVNDAAVVLGACLASATPPATGIPTPGPLELIYRGLGPPDLRAAHDAGRTLTHAELVRYLLKNTARPGI